MPSRIRSNPESWNYDHNTAIDMQLKWIIKDEYPFGFFDKETWTELNQSLQPNYQRVSKNTIKRLAFKYYIQEKKKLVKYFESFQGKVSLTIHVWDTEYISVKYLCLSCHFIDPVTWKKTKRMICICGCDNVHELVMDSVNDFKIKDKIFSICFDDFYNEGIDYEGDFEKLRKDLNPLCDGLFFETKCVSHVLISMVQLVVDSIDPVVEKVRSMLMCAMSFKADEFLEFLAAKGTKFSDPHINLPLKWNTTYKMLRAVVKQKELLVEFYNKMEKNDIDDKDWETIESVLGIFKVFHGSTVRLSSVKNPTSQLLLGESLLISGMLKEYMQDPFWEPVIVKIQSKFLEYLKNMPPVYLCAAALNPTIGVGGVLNLLEDIGRNLGLDGGFATASFTKFSDVLQEVFDYYEKMHRARANEVAEGTSTNVILQLASRKKSDIASELELYKRTDFSQIITPEECENVKVFEWWKTNGRYQYPVLGELARDILTVGAGVEVVEHAFDLNGRYLNEKACQSHPWWLQRRVFLKEHFETVGWEASGEMVAGGLEELDTDGDDEYSTDMDDEE